MSWKTQARDSKGRFLPKVVVTPPKVTRRKKEIIRQFNVFVIDDSVSIVYNKMVDSIKQGFNKIVNDVYEANSDNKIEMHWGLSFFGRKHYSHYVYTPVAPGLSQYNPNQSCTALNDGIIYAIEKTQEYLNTRVGKANVVFNIFTDGEENNSGSSVQDVNKLIEQKKSEGWMINFIGGGDETFVRKTADNYGIYQANTVSYGTNAVETTQVFDKMSKGMSSYTKAVKQRKVSNQGFFGN